MSGELIPRDSTRLFTTLYVGAGPTVEQPVSSEWFLRSFLSVGVWIRSLTMERHVRVLVEPSATDLQRLAASAGVYQEFGLAAEDALVTLVAWSVWSRDKAQSLPDIVSKVSLKSATDPTPLHRREIEAVWQKFDAGRRMSVDGRRYLNGLVIGSRTDQLPQLFGIPWKATPSVKLVPRQHARSWTKLPEAIQAYVGILTEPRSELVTACLNKIKHGPQLIVDRPKDVAARRGHPPDSVSEMGNQSLIRLLMDGKRTQETQSELASPTRVAPFILTDGENAKRLLLDSVVGLASFLHNVGFWLYRTSFADLPAPKIQSDRKLDELIRDHVALIERRAPYGT
jgi:hypothetical protein